MSMIDFIVDLLVCIKNVVVVGKQMVKVLFFKIKVVIVEVLKVEGYIIDLCVIKIENNKVEFEIVLKYFEGKLVIEILKCFLCLGLCQYCGKFELLKVFNGLGIFIIFIFKGIMIDVQVCQLGVGGEVLCFVV